MHLAIPPAPTKRNPEFIKRKNHSGKRTQEVPNHAIGPQSGKNSSLLNHAPNSLSWLKTMAGKDKPRKQDA